MLLNLSPTLFIVFLLIRISDNITPTFITTTNGFEAGTKVFTLTGATLSGGLDTNSATITFLSSFTSVPNVVLGLKKIHSTYTTIPTLHKLSIDFVASSTSKTQTTVSFTRTTSVVTEATINFIAVEPTSFIDVYTKFFNLTGTNIYDIGSGQRSTSITMSYRIKSNSTNAALVYNTIGT